MGQPATGRVNESDIPVAIAVSRAESSTAGTSQGKTSDFDYATVAYAGASGKRLWAGATTARQQLLTRPAVAVSPDGTRVCDGTSPGVSSVTTMPPSPTRPDRYAAVDAALQRPGQRADRAAAIAVSPDGHRVFVATYQATGTRCPDDRRLRRRRQQAAVGTPCRTRGRRKV